MTDETTTAQGLSALQERIGYSFENPVLLRRALTHSSLSASADVGDLERLTQRVVAS